MPPADRFRNVPAMQHRTLTPLVRTTLAAAASLLVLTACGADDSGSSSGGNAGTSAVGAADQLFDTDFQQVCDGVGQPAATAYTPVAGSISPVVVLVQQEGFMSSRSSAVRAGWERVWEADATMKMAELQLVACVTRTNAVRVQECDGYEIDGAVTDNVVHLNETTYDIVLRAAATGEEVARTSVTAADDSCPMFVSFSDGETEKEWYSFDDAAVQDFLTPHVAP